MPLAAVRAVWFRHAAVLHRHVVGSIMWRSSPIRLRGIEIAASGCLLGCHFWPSQRCELMCEVLTVARSRFTLKSVNMKYWRFVAGFLVLGALWVVVRHVLETRAQQKREATYQSALRSYSEALKPGMTRLEVEGYLRAKDLSFRQMCCVDRKDFSKRRYPVYDDLLKIGQEDAPWFCSEKSVYIAFQFTGRPERQEWPPDSADSLRAVTIYPWFEGCL